MINIDSHIRIITERLQLQPVSEEFKFDICREFTTAVTRYMPFTPDGNIHSTEAFIADAAEQLKLKKSIHLCVLKKDTYGFMGMCGLHHTDTKAIEIGLWLKTSVQGLNYGTEIVTALVDFAEKNLSPEYLLYPVDKDNTPSRKIPEKLGFIPFQTYQKNKDAGTMLTVIEYRRKCGSK